MADRTAPGDRASEPASEPSPLDVLPGFAAIAATMADAVTVTDVHRRTFLWNDAAERLYGISSAEAIGAPIDELYDSAIIGEGTSSAGARTIALATGSWRGRVADRPRVGRMVGQELVIEVVLSRIDGPSGQPIGVISVKRDVTPGVRVERELSTVISLATASGESRTRQGTADHALDVLITTTGASLAGLTVPAAGGATAILAERGMTQALRDIVVAVRWSESSAVKAVSTVGRVVKGTVALLPIAPATRRGLVDARIHTMVLVGLHREQELVGVLSLAWDRDDPVIPSDAVLLLAAAHIARGLENARLVEEIVRRADNERELGQRLRALDELIRVGGNVTSIDELAERSARFINTALGAAGTAYGLLAPGGDAYATTHMADVAPAIAEWLRTAPPEERTAFRRWRAGEGGFLTPFETGRVTTESLALAREAGVTAYAAIPIRVGDAVVGGIAAYFDRPPEELHLDRTTLDRIASVASISLANFRLRERLVASEQRYRSIFEASPDAILVITPEGPVIDVNDAAVRLYRADKSWLLGRRAPDLARFETGPIRERADALAVGETFQTKAVGVRRDGEPFPAEVEVAAVELELGRRYLVRVRDVTEQERLQSELIQAQKMEATGQLVSGVAHELNNPLAAIILSSELIRRDPDLPADLRHNADLLVEEAIRTKGIVQNLLDFARQRPPERYPTSIRQLVERVLALQSYSLGKGLIEAEVEIPDDLPAVELDRGQLQQVLVNLTHNAIYAIRHGGGSRLKIFASREGPEDDQRVRVTVMDDGPGVEPEDVAHLFEAFFTTKPASDGTGLGLPVSFGIIASHGGELRYGPSALGRGAAFTFDLPVRAVTVEDVPRTGGPIRPPDPPAATRTTETAGPIRGAAVDGSRRILVLDDEASIRVFLAKALTALGYEPVVAATGEEAVAKAAEGRYVAILCDHQMPGMTGVDVYEAIIATDPGLAGGFVMMSGDVLNQSLETFASTHRVAVLAKPFDLETLQRAIEGVAPDQPRG
ncbi:MAG: PAS domain S-box protein [Candidatus Limnocylindrales bacterium]